MLHTTIILLALTGAFRGKNTMSVSEFVVCALIRTETLAISVTLRRAF